MWDNPPAEELLKEIQALPEEEKQNLLALLSGREADTVCDFRTALSEVMQRYDKSLRELAQ